MMKITVNGKMYIGSVDSKSNVVTLTDSMPIKSSGIDRQTAIQYYKKYEMGELETEEFTGMGTTISKKELSDDEQLIMDVCELAMRYARKKSKEGMICAIFEQTMGKF
jgi:hypothetical protein